MDSYPRLADFMTDHPEAGIFRIFKVLTVQNLLHLQAELSHIESDMARMARDDGCPHDPDYQESLRSWKKMSQALPSAEETAQCSSAGEGEAAQNCKADAKRDLPHPSHWMKVLKMREVLDAYR